MKKISLLYGGLVFVAASLASCTDMLDKEPLDSFVNNSNFWNNESSVEGYANTFYNQFSGYGTFGLGDFYNQTLTDDQVDRGFANWKFTNVPGNSTEWKSKWTEIRRSNVMIQSINEYGLELDSETKNHWLGVARLMRAYQYWDLVRKFGDVPWVEHVVTVDDPTLYAGKDDRDIVMDKVLEDLNFAVNSIKEASDKKYWSRDMANAIKAHICLWEGTFRKYRSEADHQKAPDAAGAKKFLQECVNACDIIMKKPNFKLCDNYQSLYNSVTLDDNPEIIFYKEYKQSVMTHETVMYTCMSTMIHGMSKDAFDSYLFTDGKTYANTQYKDDEYNIPEPKVSANDGNQHLNLTKMFSVRDKRLSQQLDTVLCYTGNPWPRLLGGTAMTSSTGYSVSKFDNVTIPAVYRSSANYTAAPLYWLAVIYLNYAEAKAELGTITNDDLNKSINLLKDRAGLPHITVSPADQGDNDMGVSPLIWEIRRERRCELMFDNDFRYWDLIRWHQLDKLDTTNNPDITLGANISKMPSNEVEVKNGYIYGYKTYTRKYEYKHYLYPIPSDQNTLNPKLGQNPGWEEK